MTRLFFIFKVALVYRLDGLLNGANVVWYVRFFLLPMRLFPKGKKSDAERLRLALEQLGPIFIKFGQMLSTRKDLLREDYARELAKLQDNVPPFSGQQAQKIIETALKKPVDQLFASFSVMPLASASVAQVHEATLTTGQSVVVKVVRPGIERIIKQDIALLLMLARMVEHFHPDGKRLHAVEVVSDYQHTILDELDLQKEAANTSQLRRNFIESDLLYIPEVYWEYCSKNVLVMERINGIPVTNIDELKAIGIPMRILAERGLEIFFTQVFRDSFFHADMHPGNIFVSREHPQNPQYIGIDCAIVGSLSEFDQYYLARNLLAIFNRDYRLVAQLHVECGWVPAHTKATEFESAIRAVCEPIFERPLGEISFGQILLYLFQTARRFEMEVQPSLVLLQKTLLNVEGLGRQLYPELDLWQTAKPFLENWIRERYSPRAMLKQIQRHAPSWLEQLPHVPDLVLDRLSSAPNTPKNNHSTDVDKQLLLSLIKNQQRMQWLLLAALLASSAVLFKAL